MTTDINHPNVRTGVLQGAIELFRLSNEDFDPTNEADCRWLTDTYIYLLSLHAMDESGGGAAVLQVQFPGAQVEPAYPQPQGQMPQWPQGAPQGNPDPFQQPPAHQQVPYLAHQQVPYNPVPQTPTMPPPQAMPYNAPQQVTQPGQLHGGASKDDIWGAICQALQSGTINNEWYDNRASKRTQNSPDFRHKNIDANPTQTGKVYKLSAYIKDAPPWALQVLQQYPPRG